MKYKNEKPKIQPDTEMEKSVPSAEVVTGPGSFPAPHENTFGEKPHFFIYTFLQLAFALEKKDNNILTVFD